MQRRSVALLSLLVVALLGTAVALRLLDRGGESEVTRVRAVAPEQRQRVDATLLDATLLGAPAEAARRVAQKTAPVAAPAPDAPATVVPAPSAPAHEWVAPPGRLSVLVVDSARRPIAGADVTKLVWEDGSTVPRDVARTDAEGRASLELSRSSALLAVRADGFLPREILARVSERRAMVMLSMPATVIVTGFVAREPQRIVDLDVQFDDHALESDGGWFTTSNGSRAHDRVRPGSRAVRIAWTDPEGAVHHSDVVELELAESETRELRLELHPPAFVSGRLDEEVPRPIVDGVVQIRAGRVCRLARMPDEPSFGDWPDRELGSLVRDRYVVVREDGTFEASDLPRGPAMITAACSGWVSYTGPGALSSFDGASDVWEPMLDATHEAVVAMQPAARVVVRLHGPGGLPATDARVTLEISSWLRGADAQTRFLDRHYVATTGLEGTVVFEDVPSQTAYVDVDHRALRLSAFPESIQLRSGETKSLAFTLVER